MPYAGPQRGRKERQAIPLQNWTVELHIGHCTACPACSGSVLNHGRKLFRPLEPSNAITVRSTVVPLRQSGKGGDSGFEEVNEKLDLWFGVGQFELSANGGFT